MSYKIRVLIREAHEPLKQFLAEWGVHVIADVPERHEVHLGDYLPPEVIHVLRLQKGIYGVEHHVHSVR